MRWTGGRGSSNIEDRRGMGGGMAMGGGALGILGLLAYLFLGVDITGGGAGGAPQEQVPASEAPANDAQAQFVGQVLRDTEVAWGSIFEQQVHQPYQEPTLVLFEQSVRSACGMAGSAVGPFYCPGDRKVYIDLSFYDELRSRFGAPGDFAQAYVIAHEVGHHVQNLLGTSREVERAMRGSSETEANRYSVMQELQADCYAGIWAKNRQPGTFEIDDSDIDEALTAAAAIGDDRLQEQAQGYVVPESFTHGSSAQRQRWFREGFRTGDLRACDTFSRGV
ncbi:MAG TPA: neutral zinc metallopeptidase [Longimicrobium sp.]|nr:neutral zinc metallopeptidase [Longimicrobium sp.]